MELRRKKCEEEEEKEKKPNNSTFGWTMESNSESHCSKINNWFKFFAVFTNSSLTPTHMHQVKEEKKRRKFLWNLSIENVCGSDPAILSNLRNNTYCILDFWILLFHLYFFVFLFCSQHCFRILCFNNIFVISVDKKNDFIAISITIDSFRNNFSAIFQFFALNSV